jgi:hypothetical protein
MNKGEWLATHSGHFTPDNRPPEATGYENSWAQELGSRIGGEMKGEDKLVPVPKHHDVNSVEEP